MNRQLWMSMCLATALAGCAHDGQPQQQQGGARIYPGAYDNPDGGAITVVIDGRTYNGIAQRTPTNTGGPPVYQALLTTPNGPGLRCQLVDEGRRRMSGTCIDDNQRMFEVRVGR